MAPTPPAPTLPPICFERHQWNMATPRRQAGMQGASQLFCLLSLTRTALWPHHWSSCHVAEGPPLLSFFSLSLPLPLSAPYSPWRLPGLPGHKDPPLLVSASVPYNHLHTLKRPLPYLHSFYHQSLIQVCPAIKARHSWLSLPSLNHLQSPLTYLHSYTTNP